MKTKDFLRQHEACRDGAKWALSISEEMDDVWDAMIEQGKHNWLIWTATRPRVFPGSVLQKLPCRFIRETPLSDGRKVWDLLTDERSRRAVEVAELYADGKATKEELEAARAAARGAVYDAAYATYAADAASSAAFATTTAVYATARAAFATTTAAYATARAAARAAARGAAKAAQAQMIAEMGNPFKERAKQ